MLPFLISIFHPAVLSPPGPMTEPVFLRAFVAPSIPFHPADLNNHAMPYADLPHTRLFYVLDGPPEKPVLVLSNSLGTNAEMWVPQLPVFSREFRVLRYDTRGHGRSAVPAENYDFSALTDDVVGLLDHLGIERVNFCGLSMGGPTGMGLALAHPRRIEKLILCNTAARIGTSESWGARIEAVSKHGLQTMSPTIFERWLTPSYRSAEPRLSAMLLDMLRGTDDVGYMRACSALQSLDLREQVGAISCPVLVISGTHDEAATPQQGRELTTAIPGAEYRELNAAHISNWEKPDEFAELVRDFLHAEQ